VFILSNGMAFHLAAGRFLIGQAFGSRWKTVGAVYAFDRMALVRSVWLHFVYWYVYGFAWAVSERAVKILNLRERLRFRTVGLGAVSVHGFVD